MIGLLLRLRFLLFLARLFILPVLAFSLALLVFVLIGWSLYMLMLVKTARNIPENPYLYTPLLFVELFLTVLLLYCSIVYINKLRKRHSEKTGGGK